MSSKKSKKRIGSTRRHHQGLKAEEREGNAELQESSSAEHLQPSEMPTCQLDSVPENTESDQHDASQTRSEKLETGALAEICEAETSASGKKRRMGSTRRAKQEAEERKEEKKVESMQITQEEFNITVPEDQYLKEHSNIPEGVSDEARTQLIEVGGGKEQAEMTEDESLNEQHRLLSGLDLKTETEICSVKNPSPAVNLIVSVTGIHPNEKEASNKQDQQSCVEMFEVKEISKGTPLQDTNQGLDQQMDKSADVSKREEQWGGKDVNLESNIDIESITVEGDNKQDVFLRKESGERMQIEKVDDGSVREMEAESSRVQDFDMTQIRALPSTENLSQVKEHSQVFHPTNASTDGIVMEGNQNLLETEQTSSINISQEEEKNSDYVLKPKKIMGSIRRPLKSIKMIEEDTGYSQVETQEIRENTFQDPKLAEDNTQLREITGFTDKLEMAFTISIRGEDLERTDDVMEGPKNKHKDLIPGENTGKDTETCPSAERTHHSKLDRGEGTSINQEGSSMVEMLNPGLLEEHISEHLSYHSLEEEIQVVEQTELTENSHFIPEFTPQDVNLLQEHDKDYAEEGPESPGDQEGQSCSNMEVLEQEEVGDSCPDCVETTIEDAERIDSFSHQIGFGTFEQEHLSSSPTSKDIVVVPPNVHAKSSSLKMYHPDMKHSEEAEQGTQPYILSYTTELEAPSSSTDILDLSQSLHVESIGTSETSTLPDPSESSFKLLHHVEEKVVKQGAVKQKRRMGSTRRTKTEHKMEDTCEAVTTEGDDATEDMNVKTNADVRAEARGDILEVEFIGTSRETEFVTNQIHVESPSIALTIFEQDENVDKSTTAEIVLSSIPQCNVQDNGQKQEDRLEYPDIATEQLDDNDIKDNEISILGKETAEVATNQTDIGMNSHDEQQCEEEKKWPQSHIRSYTSEVSKICTVVPDFSHSIHVECIDTSKIITFPDHSESSLTLQPHKEDGSVKQGASRQKRRMGSTRRTKREQKMEETCEVMSAEGDNSNENMDVKTLADLRAEAEAEEDIISASQETEFVTGQTEVQTLSTTLTPIEQDQYVDRSTSAEVMSSSFPKCSQEDEGTQESQHQHFEATAEQLDDDYLKKCTKIFGKETAEANTAVEIGIFNEASVSDVGDQLEGRENDKLENSLESLGHQKLEDIKMEVSEEVKVETNVSPSTEDSRPDCASNTVEDIETVEKAESFSCQINIENLTHLGSLASEKLEKSLEPLGHQNIEDINMKVSEQAEEKMLSSFTENLSPDCSATTVENMDISEKTESFSCKISVETLTCLGLSNSLDPFPETAVTQQNVSLDVNTPDVQHSEEAEQGTQVHILSSTMESEAPSISMDISDFSSSLAVESTGRSEADTVSECSESSLKLKHHEEEEGVKQAGSRQKRRMGSTRRAKREQKMEETCDVLKETVPEQAEVENKLSPTEDTSPDSVAPTVEDMDNTEKTETFSRQIGLENLTCLESLASSLPDQIPDIATQQRTHADTSNLEMYSSDVQHSEEEEKRTQVPFLGSNLKSEVAIKADVSDFSHSLDHEKNGSVKQGASRQKRRMGSTRRTKREQKMEETCGVMSAEGDSTTEDMNMNIDADLRVETGGDVLTVDIILASKETELATNQTNVETVGMASSSDEQVQYADSSISSEMVSSIPQYNPQEDELKQENQCQCTDLNTEQQDDNDLKDDEMSIPRQGTAEAITTVGPGILNEGSMSEDGGQFKKHEDEKLEKSLEPLGHQNIEEINMKVSEQAEEKMLSSSTENLSPDCSATTVENMDISEKTESFSCKISVETLTCLGSSNSLDPFPETAVTQQNVSLDVNTPDVQHSEEAEQGTQVHILSSTMESEAPSISMDISDFSSSLAVESTGRSEADTVSECSESSLKLQHHEEEEGVKQATSRQKRRMGSTRRAKREQKMEETCDVLKETVPEQAEVENKLSPTEDSSPDSVAPTVEDMDNTEKTETFSRQIGLENLTCLESLASSLPDQIPDIATQQRTHPDTSNLEMYSTDVQHSEEEEQRTQVPFLGSNLESEVAITADVSDFSHSLDHETDGSVKQGASRQKRRMGSTRRTKREQKMEETCGDMSVEGDSTTEDMNMNIDADLRVETGGDVLTVDIILASKETEPATNHTNVETVGMASSSDEQVQYADSSISSEMVSSFPQYSPQEDELKQENLKTPEVNTPDVQHSKEAEQGTQVHILSSTMESEAPSISMDISDFSSSLAVECTVRSEAVTVSECSESSSKLQHHEEEEGIKQGTSMQKRRIGSTRRTNRKHKIEETCEVITEGDDATEDMKVKTEVDVIAEVEGGISIASKENEFVTTQTDVETLTIASTSIEQDQGVTSSTSTEMVPSFPQTSLQDQHPESHQESHLDGTKSSNADETKEVITKTDIEMQDEENLQSEQISSREKMQAACLKAIPIEEECKDYQTQTKDAREVTVDELNKEDMSSHKNPFLSIEGTPEVTISLEAVDVYSYTKSHPNSCSPHDSQINVNPDSDVIYCSENCETGKMESQVDLDDCSTASEPEHLKRDLKATPKQKIGSTRRVNRREGEKKNKSKGEEKEEMLIISKDSNKEENILIIQDVEEVEEREECTSETQRVIQNDTIAEEQAMIEGQIQNTVPEMSVTVSQYQETEVSPGLARRRKLGSTRRSRKEQTERKYVVMDGMLMYTDTETNYTLDSQLVDGEEKEKEERGIHESEENTEVMACNTVVSPPESLETIQEMTNDDKEQCFLSRSITTAEQPCLVDMTGHDNSLAHGDTVAVNSGIPPTNSTPCENTLRLTPLETLDSSEERKPRKKRMGSSRKISQHKYKTESQGEADVRNEDSDNVTNTDKPPVEQDTGGTGATDEVGLEGPLNDKLTDIHESERSKPASEVHSNPEGPSVAEFNDQSHLGLTEISESSGNSAAETSFDINLCADDSPKESRSVFHKRKMGSSRRGQGLGNRMKGAATVEGDVDDINTLRQATRVDTALQSTEDFSVEGRQLLLASQSSKSDQQPLTQGETPNELIDERVFPESAQCRTSILSASSPSSEPQEDNPFIDPQSNVKKRKMGSTRKNMRRHGEDTNSDLKREQAANAERCSDDTTTGDMEVHPMPAETVMTQKMSEIVQPEDMVTEDESTGHGSAGHKQGSDGNRRKMGSRRGGQGYRGIETIGAPEDQPVSQGQDNDSSLLQGTQGNVHSEGVPEQGASKQGSQIEREIQKLEQPPSGARGKSDLERKYDQGDSHISLGEAVVFNIVMVGDSSVGKTSFIRRLDKGEFLPDSSATLGVDSSVLRMVVDDKLVKLQIWDTAGQERFHSITRTVLHKAQGLILMYDISSCQSFSAVHKWIACIEEGAPSEVIILLLGNKIDSEDRQVLHPEGKRLAEEYNIHFMECSAATGYNVSEAMETLARLLKQTIKENDQQCVSLHKPQQKKSGCC